MQLDLRGYYKIYCHDGSFFVQVLGTNVVVLRRQLAGGGTESMEGVEKVGTTGEALG